VEFGSECIKIMVSLYETTLELFNARPCYFAMLCYFVMQLLYSVRHLVYVDGDETVSEVRPPTALLFTSMGMRLSLKCGHQRAYCLRRWGWDCLWSAATNGLIVYVDGDETVSKVRPPTGLLFTSMGMRLSLKCGHQRAYCLRRWEWDCLWSAATNGLIVYVDGDETVSEVVFNWTRPAFTESNVEDNDVAAISFPLEYAQYIILPIKMSCFIISCTYCIQNIKEPMLRREHANNDILGTVSMWIFRFDNTLLLRTIIEALYRFVIDLIPRYLIRSELVITEVHRVKWVL
jgi:hypothetical protein